MRGDEAVIDLWHSALSRLSSKVAKQNYELWIGPIECRAIDGDRILLRAPNQYVRLWFEQNYLPFVLEELRREHGREFQVEFEILEAPVPPRTAEPVAAAEG